VKGHGVSHLGGRERALLRHLQRRGAQTTDDLVQHFVYGNHGWYPEDLDRAIAELQETGHLAPLDRQGFYRLTIRSPL
jgi:hypothetical protein